MSSPLSHLCSHTLALKQTQITCGGSPPRVKPSAEKTAETFLDITGPGAGKKSLFPSLFLDSGAESRNRILFFLVKCGVEITGL